MGDVIAFEDYAGRRSRHATDGAACVQNPAMARLESACLKFARARSRGLSEDELLQEVKSARKKMCADTGFWISEDGRYLDHLNNANKLHIKEDFRDRLIDLWAKYIYRAKHMVHGREVLLNEMTDRMMLDKALELDIASERRRGFGGFRFG